ncbi:hypothetical protein [Longimicrobium sp.]|uniref:hypothetical protein n=1 Tax=Longimicrobium sp. TaxID=2029185 RepID=UPI003B3BA679
MNDPATFLMWFLPVFVVGFAVMWLGIVGLLAEIGGWGELAQLYREPEGTVRAPVRRFGMASLDLRRGRNPLPANYRNCMILEVAQAGLHLRPWRPFRFRHPPLLIPWPQMERLQTGRMLFFATLTIHPRGVGTRIRMWGAPAKAVEEAWRQAAASARPVPV